MRCVGTLYVAGSTWQLAQRKKRKVYLYSCCLHDCSSGYYIARLPLILLACVSSTST